MTAKFGQSFRGVSPEVKLKLKLLSISMQIPMYRLLEIMVDSLWEQKKDQLTTIVGSARANKEVQKILEKIGAR